MLLNVVPFPRTKALSTRAIFVWQLYVAIFISPCRWLDKYLLLIYVSNNFAQRRCPWKAKKQDGESQKTCQTCWMRKCWGLWGLGSTDDVEKIVTFYVASRLHGQFFMWQFLFATLKLTRQFFSKCSCQIKIGHLSSSTRANKNCHIKIAI